MNQKSFTKIILITIIIAIVAIGGYFVLSKKLAMPLVTQPPTPPATDKEPSPPTSTDNIITSFLLKRAESWISDEGVAFCESNVTWEKNISPTRKVAYSIAGCDSVVLKDGDLRGTSGGDQSGLYLLEKKSDSWEVVDSFYPERGFTQSGLDWVEENYSFLSEDERIGANMNHFSTAGIIDQAAQYYGVKVPKYRLNSCGSNKDCQNSDICVKHGVNNPGSNTCVRACAANKDCGIAHTCRYQCVNGENGCPDTSRAICLPDLLHPDLEKNPDEIIE